MPEKPPAPTPSIYCPGSYPYPPRWLPPDHPFLKAFACAHARHPHDNRSPFLDCPDCDKAYRKRRDRCLVVAFVAAVIIFEIWRACGCPR